MFNILVIFAIALTALGCNSDKETATNKAENAADAAEVAEPDLIAVQHILIGFQGSVPGKNITRTKEEARELANKVFKRAQAGEDYDKLVAEYTDDAVPGIYKMANFGLPADMANGVYARDRLVQAFGDVGFPLEIGGIGLADFDPVKSRYGWHIIKRVE
jgi:hypothetical protein